MINVSAKYKLIPKPFDASELITPGEVGNQTDADQYFSESLD